MVPMPNLFNNNRVFVVNFFDTNTKYFDHQSAFKALTCIADVLLEYDYFSSSVIIIDSKNVCFGHVKNLTLHHIKNYYKVFEVSHIFF